MLTRRDALKTLGLAAGTAGVAGTSAVATAGPAAAAAASPMRAVLPAAAFLDSIAVNTHFGYFDTPYHQGYDRVRRLLVATGVKHVRDYSTFRTADLARDGVATTVLVDSDMNGRGDPVQMVRALTPLVRSGAVGTVEGTNEADLFWTGGKRSYKGRAFPEGAVLWQRDLYRAVKDDPALRGLTVIGPSLGRTYWGGGNPYRAGELADSADWGNFHPYPAGNPYTNQYPYGGIKKYYADSDFPSGALDVHPITMNTYCPPFGHLPMAATETGYSTWRWGQSERTQGLYTPRMFAENFRLGVPRTYAYELLDTFGDPAGGRRDAHFGWLRHDLSPKPVYRAVQATVAAVRGAGLQGAGTVRALEARISVQAPPGYDPAATHHLALGRPDGSVVVLVWHEVSSNDTTGLQMNPRRPLRELGHPAVKVSLDLGQDVSGVTTTYLADDGSARRYSHARAGTTLTFNVTDRLTFVEIPAPR